MGKAFLGGWFSPPPLLTCFRHITELNLYDIPYLSDIQF